jgi:hypothetical protein
MTPSRVPRVDLRRYRPDHAATRLLTRRRCEELRVVPVKVVGESLVLAMSRLDHPATVEEITMLTGLRVEVVSATLEQIALTIAACYPNVS